MESNLELGVQSDMQEMVVGDVPEVLAQVEDVLLENVNIVSGLLGVGVDVLSLVDMESNMEVGGQSNMQEMVVGDVPEVVGEVLDVWLEDLVHRVVTEVTDIPEV